MVRLIVGVHWCNHNGLKSERWGLKFGNLASYNFKDIQNKLLKKNSKEVWLPMKNVL